MLKSNTLASCIPQTKTILYIWTFLGSYLLILGAIGEFTQENYHFQVVEYIKRPWNL